MNRSFAQIVSVPAAASALTPVVAQLLALTMGLTAPVAASASTLRSGTARSSSTAAKAKFDQADLSEFSHVDRQREIPRPALRRALYYYKQYGSQFGNRSYLAVADFSKHSSEPRLYIVNVKSGEVESLHVSHGRGSDPANRGWAARFSNQPSSKATSLGFYRTAEIYSGEHGRSLKLDGLSSSNNNARVRGIVVHAAWYVREADERAGRSEGCLAVDPHERDRVLGKLKGGALVYAWAGQGANG